MSSFCRFCKIEIRHVITCTLYFWSVIGHLCAPNSSIVVITQSCDSGTNWHLFRKLFLNDNKISFDYCLIILPHCSPGFAHFLCVRLKNRSVLDNEPITSCSALPCLPSVLQSCRSIPFKIAIYRFTYSSRLLSAVSSCCLGAYYLHNIILLILSGTRFCSLHKSPK